MYFTAPSGRPVDVMVDRLVMCHTLDLRPSLKNSSLTLDPADLLLSKLQIIELNGKDVHDITHLLSGVGIDGRGGRAIHQHGPVRRGLSAGLGLVAHLHRQPGEVARAGQGDPAVVPEARATTR